MDLPDTCLRGIRKPGWVTPENVVETAAFVPDPNTAEQRKDGGLEVSINWEDDGDAVDFTLRQNNAQHGAARLARAQISRTSRESSVAAIAGRGVAPLSCERQELDDNPYHGNIVYDGALSKPVRKMLAAALALHSHYLPT